MNKSNKILITVSFLFVINLTAQNVVTNKENYIEILGRELKQSEIFIGPDTKKLPGHYSTENWGTLIDSYWGEGLPSSEKLRIFNLAVNTLDRNYAAFQNLEINFDSLTNVYRKEIEGGVSRGRFAAIMNYLSFAMMEAHTILADLPVNCGTAIYPGVPLFVVGPWQDNSRFGAALTPLPDSTLLVYRALPNQQLGLKKGDIVLGYDGIPWKDLYKEIIKAQIPIRIIGVWASAKKSMEHCLLASAGLNWHLFDTIDIVKASSGDTLHLATGLMIKQSGFIWGNEQLPVPGVPFPDFSTNKFVYWGIIDGTNIGYIYVTSWNPDTRYQISSQFHDAIDSLMYSRETSGMVLDFRYNSGGYMGVAHEGYSLLFNERIPSVSFDKRTGTIDHFGMEPYPGYTESVFTIPGNSNSFYDKPIAVLTGPGAISNGDFESWRMKLHPMTRLFGKPSCGAFATSILPDLNSNDWFFYLTYGNSYPVNSPGEYLVHSDLEIDEEVWLTKEGVLSGNDDVVDKAVNWIENFTNINDENILPDKFILEQNYPNPFSHTSTKIRYEIPGEEYSMANKTAGENYKVQRNSQNVKLSVFDILGQEVAVLVNQSVAPGKYEIEFSAAGLSSGIYVYQLEMGQYSLSKKMIYLK